MSIPLDQIICHDVAKGIPLPNECIDVVVTSPPYWGLRCYGKNVRSIFGGDPKCKHKWGDKLIYRKTGGWKIETTLLKVRNLDGINSQKELDQGNFCQKCGAWYGQLGLEPHPSMYIDHLVQIFQEIKRVLKPTGSIYLNLGDTYYGSGGAGGDYNRGGLREGQLLYRQKKSDRSPWLQPKQLMMIPARIAIALQDISWILRNDIIWHKLNTMPSSVKDRLNVTHEHVFHFVKQQKYYYDLDAIREPHKASSLQRAKYDFNLIPRAWKQEAIPVSGGKNINIGCHPNGKNPGDIIKHDKAVGRIGNFSYDDPLHTKEYHPASKNPGDFWDITTQPFTGYSEDLEHFAVFPENLVVRPLLACCPRFVCKSCGKPRERITKGTSPQAFNIRVRDVKKKRIKHIDRKASIEEITRYEEGVTHVGSGKTTVGWSDCGCNKGFESGIVLDPFAGRGTVGKVAKKLGFHYILIDIKPEYCELARLYIAGQKYKISKNQKRLDEGEHE